MILPLASIGFSLLRPALFYNPLDIHSIVKDVAAKPIFY